MRLIYFLTLLTFCPIQPMFYCKYLANAAAHPAQSAKEIADYFNHQSLLRQEIIFLSACSALTPIVSPLIECKPIYATLASFTGIANLTVITVKELKKIKAEIIAKSLCKKVKHGDIAAVKQLLDDGADPDYPKAKHGYAPLHYAAMKRRIDMFTLLLEYGANINARTNDGWTPLMHLVNASSLPEHEYPELVEQFLQMKPDIDVKNNFEDNALLNACSKTNSLVAIPLLEAGANIHAKDKDDNTPLHWAVRARNKEIIRQLLARGADKTVHNQFGQTPIDHANDDTKELLQLNNVFRQLRRREIGQLVKFK